MNTLCSACGTSINVIGQPLRIKELLGSTLWGDKFPCISCGGEADRRLGFLPSASLELTPEEYFRALHGLGTPKEAICPPSMIESLLRDGVESIDAEERAGKTLLRSILLCNGLRMHLWVSPQGPVVYKVTTGDGDVHQVTFRTKRGSVSSAQGGA